MTAKKRIKWIDIYQSDIPVLARLLRSTLLARGFIAKYQRKKVQGYLETVPFVRVTEDQAEVARDLLAAYQLT